MLQYLNVHAVLQVLYSVFWCWCLSFQESRKAAKKSGQSGPKVMVVGGVDSGKTTLCKILCNYAAREGENVSKAFACLLLLNCRLPTLIWILAKEA